jgi:hypothetical protein
MITDPGLFLSVVEKMAPALGAFRIERPAVVADAHTFLGGTEQMASAL